MQTAKIRTAIFVKNPAPSSYMQHCCFLNPTLPEKLEVFDPEITIKTPSWQSKLTHPTVRYETLGSEPYKMLPERLIKMGREYVFISKLSQNTPANLEYVMTYQRIQSIFGVGMQDKPIHVFDIDIRNDMQVDFGFGVNFENTPNQIGSAVQNFDLVSSFNSTTHVGEIKQIWSYTITQFEDYTGFDVINNYFDAPELSDCRRHYSNQEHKKLRRLFDRIMTFKL